MNCLQRQSARENSKEGVHMTLEQCLNLFNKGITLEIENGRVVALNSKEYEEVGCAFNNQESRTGK